MTNRSPDSISTRWLIEERMRLSARVRELEAQVEELSRDNAGWRAMYIRESNAFTNRYQGGD